MIKQVELAEQVRDFVNSFNITVDLLVKFFPHKQLLLENVFYDVQSFAEAMFSEFQPYVHALGQSYIGGNGQI